MGWVKRFVGGFVLLLILLSLATSFATYLEVTHGSCPQASPNVSSSQLFESTYTFSVLKRFDWIVSMRWPTRVCVDYG